MTFPTLPKQTDKPQSPLPQGFNCGDCFRTERCAVIFSVLTEKSTECAYEPSKFYARPLAKGTR